MLFPLVTMHNSIHDAVTNGGRNYRPGAIVFSLVFRGRGVNTFLELFTSGFASSEVYCQITD